MVHVKPLLSNEIRKNTFRGGWCNHTRVTDADTTPKHEQTPTHHPPPARDIQTTNENRSQLMHPINRLVRRNPTPNNPPPKPHHADKKLTHQDSPGGRKTGEVP